MNKCRVWKVKHGRSIINLFTDPPVGIWKGWCDECNCATGQYWSFGATLGAALYHITVNHRKT